MPAPSTSGPGPNANHQHEAPDYVPYNTCIHRYNTCSRTFNFSFLARQVRGSGPWGLPLPWETRRMLDQVQAALEPHWPRLQQLAALPGAVEVCSCPSTLFAVS